MEPSQLNNSTRIVFKCVDRYKVNTALNKNLITNKVKQVDEIKFDYTVINIISHISNLMF